MSVTETAVKIRQLRDEAKMLNKLPGPNNAVAAYRKEALKKNREADALEHSLGK